MTKIKTFKEFYTELDGKTEHDEIEEIMNRATIAILKVYLPYKAYEGMSAWKKADYVNAATDYTLEKIELEEEDSKVLHELSEKTCAEKVAEEIRSADTAESIAEALLKCGKVSDMAETFRTVTGESFYGKIVSVEKESVARNMSWQIKRHLEFEAFKGLGFNEKVTELCAKEAYDAKRFLYAFTLEELRKVAEIIGADTSKVNAENEIHERLDYMTAISHKLITSPNGIKIQFPETSEDSPTNDINSSEVRFDAGKTYEYHGVEYTIDERTECYATMKLSTGETVCKQIDKLPNGIEVITVSEWPEICYLKATDEVKPHYVFEIGKKYAGKLNGESTVFTVEDYEEDVIALTAANGEFYSCVVGYFIEGAFGKSDTVTMRNSKWTVSVTARDIVEEQPAEEAEARTIPATVQAEDANFSKEIIKLLIEALEERKTEASQPEALYEDESYSDLPGDNSCPDQDIPEAHTPDEFTAWTNEDFYSYFPDGEMTEPDLVELTLEELDALNEYLARKEAEKWRELDEIRAMQKYPLVVVKKGYVPPEDMMLYPIGMYDSYDEMKIALDKNFEMVDRCKDGTDMQYLFYTCNLHTAYMMVKARGYETRFEEWQSIKDNVVHDFIQQELARREKILKRETISQKKEEITAMATKYAEIRGTIRVIKKGVTEIHKGIKMLEKQGQPHDELLSVIEGAKDEYRRLRREGFLLWRKLLRVMSVEEIRRVCESYMARCEEEKRRHMRK